MSQEIRQELIQRNLGIRPISHGQIYTFQIALPESKKTPISLEQRQAIEASLLAHQSNLLTLIVRRTTAYDDEDIEYEVVYGADWLQVVQDINLDMVWAWVFDLTDEQAIATEAEMQRLLGQSAIVQQSPQPQVDNAAESPPPKPFDLDTLVLESLLDRKLQLVMDSLKQVITASLTSLKQDVEEKIKVLHYRLETQDNHPSGLSDLTQQLDQLRQTLEQVGPRTSAIRPFAGPKLDLRSASATEITTALKQVGTQEKQIKAALSAIDYWRQQDLTWDNLRQSARASKGSAHKIDHFAEGTFNRLQTIGEIIDSPES